LGRTARAGKNGQGILICFPTEVKAMIKTLNEIPIEIKPPSPSDTAEAFRSSNEQLYFRIRRVLAMISSQTEIGMELNAQATATWLSWVGFYKR
jgi:superfamily II DNA/RNA helicase